MFPSSTSQPLHSQPTDFRARPRSVRRLRHRWRRLQLTLRGQTAGGNETILSSAMTWHTGHNEEVETARRGGVCRGGAAGERPQRWPPKLRFGGLGGVTAVPPVTAPCFIVATVRETFGEGNKHVIEWVFRLSNASKVHGGVAAWPNFLRVTRPERMVTWRTQFSPVDDNFPSTKQVAPSTKP